MADVVNFHCSGVTGAGFQTAGNPDEEKDVVSEHEDKTDCSGNHNCLDSHHSIVCMRWLQLLMILRTLLVLLLLVNCFLMRLLVILSVLTRPMLV